MIALLIIYAREMKTYVHTKTCTQVVTAALSVIAKGKNNPNALQWGKQTEVHPHHGILLSNVKELTADTRGNSWMDFKGIMQSEKVQPPEIVSCVMPFIQHSENDKIIEMEKALVVTRGER